MIAMIQFVDRRKILLFLHFFFTFFFFIVQRAADLFPNFFRYSPNKTPRESAVKRNLLLLFIYRVYNILFAHFSKNYSLTQIRFYIFEKKI